MGAACSTPFSASGSSASSSSSAPPSPQLLADSQALLRRAKATATSAAFDFDAAFRSALARDAAVLLFSVSPANRSSLLHRAARERDSERLELLLRTLEEGAGELFNRYWGWRGRTRRPAAVRASARAAALRAAAPSSSSSSSLSSSPPLAPPVTPRARSAPAAGATTPPPLRPVGSSSSLASSSPGAAAAAEITPAAAAAANDNSGSSSGRLPSASTPGDVDVDDDLDFKGVVVAGGGVRGGSEAAAVAAAAAAADAAATASEEEHEEQERDEDDEEAEDDGEDDYDDEGDEEQQHQQPWAPATPPCLGFSNHHQARRRYSPPPPPPPSRPPLPPPPRDPASPDELVALFLDARDRRGQTALALAARAGDAPAVRRLLKAGASPFVLDRQGRSPLHCAAQHGHASVARALLEAEVRLSERAPLPAAAPVAAAAPRSAPPQLVPVRVGDAFVVEARSPLFEAALERLAAADPSADDAVAAALAMLLPTTPPPPSSASSSSSSVDVAASAASWLLPPHRRVRFVDLRTTAGFSALHHAAFLGHADVAAELLAAGASVALPSTNADVWGELPLDAGSNALHAAAAAAAGRGARMAAMLLRAHAAAERRRVGGGADEPPSRPVAAASTSLPPDAPWQSWERDPAADPRLARTSRGETPSALAAARDHAAAAELLSPAVPALWMGRRALQQLQMQHQRLRGGRGAAAASLASGSPFSSSGGGGAAVATVPPLSALAAAALRAHLRERLTCGCHDEHRDHDHHQGDGQATTAGPSEECGVCLDDRGSGGTNGRRRQWAALSPCRHRLCAACALAIVEGAAAASMAATAAAGLVERPPRCPFCRSAIANVDLGA